LPDKSFADLLAEAGIQPSAATQYAQSLQRPVPYRNYTPPRPMPRTMRPPEARMFDQNPGVQQQAAAQIRRQNAVGQDAMLREAQGPANNQFADAGMVALETTGIPAIRRSYDAFEAGKPREGIYEGIWGGLGLAGTLGAIPGRGRVPRSPMREPVLPTMREASAPPPGSVLPVRPRQPFRQSLIGGSDDLSGASRGVFSEGPPDGMPRPAPDAGPSGGSSARVEGVAPNQRRVMVTDRSGEEYGFEVLEGNTAVRLRQPYLPKRARRQGLGVAAYEAAIAYAEAQGKTFISDTAVSPAARHVYDALERRGYRVERHNPEALRDSNLGRDLPDYYGNDQGGAPLFTVRGRTPTPPPSAASGGETLGGDWRGNARFMDERLTPQENKAIEMSRNNFLREEIAEEMDITNRHLGVLLSNARAQGIEVERLVGGPKADANGWTAAQLFEMRQRGLTPEQIAERTGAPVGSVRVRIRQEAIRRGIPAREPEYTPDDVARWSREQEAGDSYAIIAAREGRTKNLVHSAVVRYRARPAPPDGSTIRPDTSKSYRPGPRRGLFFNGGR